MAVAARTTIHDLLETARAQLTRLGPEQARDAVRDGAVMVDIRTESQRERDGSIPGAVCHARNVLEWRADPASDHSDPALAGDLRRTVIVVCDEGYQSQPGGGDAPGARLHAGDRPRRRLPGLARGRPPGRSAAYHVVR